MVSEGEIKWRQFFPEGRRDLYSAESEDLFKVDDLVQGLLDLNLAKALNYEQRSRNLLNVIFNLIARHEAKIPEHSPMLPLSLQRIRGR